jgi:LysM repeat protein
MVTSIRRKGPQGRHIGTAALTVLLVVGASNAEARPVRTTTVKRGDTLSQIALTQFKSARKWVALYRWNREVVGKNPHLIYPGQVLLLSEAMPATSPRKPHATKPAPVEVARATERPPAAVDPSPVSPVIEPPEAPVAALPPAPEDGPLPFRELGLPAKPAFEPAPNPWLAAGASTLFPGAGHALVGDWGRGGLYAGAAAVLYGAALYGLNSDNAPLTRASSYALMGISLVSPLDAFLSAQSRTSGEPEEPRKEARK